jgi:uncharacterized protein RhaS with RHS repeats
MYYLRARYYNPLTGRFMSRDPEDGKAIDPKSLHKYLYAGGDPVDALDPTGRDLVEFIKVNILSVVLTKAYACTFSSLSAGAFAILAGSAGLNNDNDASNWLWIISGVFTVAAGVACT